MTNQPPTTNQIKLTDAIDAANLPLERVKNLCAWMIARLDVPEDYLPSSQRALADETRNSLEIMLSDLLDIDEALDCFKPDKQPEAK